MPKLWLKLLLLAFSAVFLIYLGLPSPEFPAPPEGSLQSNEPGDIKDQNVKAYFTDLSREEIITSYQEKFRLINFQNLPSFTIRLANHPPEDARTVIREQIQSSYLEELVHPFRESIYINGFEPREEKDKIVVNGKNFKNKIVIKYVRPSGMERILVGIGIAFGLFLISKTIKLFLKI
jgi:hypothetical protein